MSSRRFPPRCSRVPPKEARPTHWPLSPDGETLFVANADNNCVAVIDVEEPRASAWKGFIPTGWYPTAVAVTPDGKICSSAWARALQTKPNPIQEGTSSEETEKIEGVRRLPFPYIGTTMNGRFRSSDVPDDKKLKEYSAQVYRNCPYSDKLLTAAAYAQEDRDPVQGRRPEPDQIHHLHHQGKPHLRSGLRRPGLGPTRKAMATRRCACSHAK